MAAPKAGHGRSAIRHASIAQHCGVGKATGLRRPTRGTPTAAVRAAAPRTVLLGVPAGCWDITSPSHMACRWHPMIKDMPKADKVSSEMEKSGDAGRCVR